MKNSVVQARSPRVTLSAVATAAGVGRTTVSDILNRNSADKYSDDTVQRVTEAVLRLGYTPARAAQQLARGRSGQIGLILMRNFSNPFFARVADEVEREARRRKYRLQLALTHGDPIHESGCIAQMQSDAVEGLLVGPVYEPLDLDMHQSILQGQMPIILFGEEFGTRYDTVGLDFAAGIRLAAGHLVEKGHRRVGYLGAPKPRAGKSRTIAFEQMMRSAGVDADGLVIWWEDLGSFDTSWKECLRFADRWLAMPASERPTAMICLNDQVATVAINAFHARGLRVPADISLIGCDNLPEGKYLVPALTTVDNHVEVQMQTAVEMLLKRIEDPSLARQTTSIQPTLVVRESVRDLTTAGTGAPSPAWRRANGSGGAMAGLLVSVAMALMTLLSGPAWAGEATQDAVPSAQTSNIVTSPAGTSPVMDARRFRAEVDQQLAAELSLWFPRAVDYDLGGFHSGFGMDWSRRTSKGPSLVFQSRMIWTAASVANAMPERAEEYRKYVSHGMKYLSKTLWDEQMGGFYWERKPDGERGDEKHSYGIAFGIYAASAAHAAGEEGALDLAMRAFEWLDRAAHDKSGGGYSEALARDGKPLLAPQQRAGVVQPFDAAIIPYGYKSMNCHIHLMEAFNALYQQSKSPLVRERLEEVFRIVRDRIYVEPGSLNQLFTPDWRPIPALDSYGHDVETAFLLLETARTLGMADDPRTNQVARALVDHALAVGWDDEFGGFYDEGPTFRSDGDLGRVNTRKVWWVQAEGLNALLLMHELHGTQTPRYWQAAIKQWEFIVQHQVDPVHGGWLGEVPRNGAQVPQGKGHDWKAAYHTGRALLLARERLKHLNGESGKLPE